MDKGQRIDWSPYGRLAASHIGQLLLVRGLRWQDRLGIDRVDTLIVQVVISAQLAHLSPLGTGLDAAETQKRPVSVLAVARSMGLAYETTRRRVALLAAQRLVRPAGNGFVVPADPRLCGAGDSLAVCDSEALYALLERMRVQGFRNLPAVSPPGADPARVARAIVDFAARSLEGFTEQHGSMNAGSIWAAIIVANVRHLLDRTDLPAAFAQDHDPLDEALRRPASIGEIAAAVRLPLATVRRHVAAMIDRGAVVAVGRRVLVPDAALRAPKQCERSRSNIAHLRRLFDDVARLSPATAPLRCAS